MKNQEQSIWGIHGGKTGDADKLFLNENCVAIGWHQMGDLASIKPDRESFKAKVSEVYPDKKPGAIPNNAGQLYRFVHEMQKGDLIVYPSKSDKQVHIGQVEGDYVYKPKSELTYPQRRAVKWLRSVPRTRFSQGALYEIGSAMSLFQIKNYAEEFRQIVDGKKTLPEPSDEPSILAHITEDIETNTRDYILKRMGQTLKGHPLAAFVEHLLRAMGYHTRLSPEGPDGGIDIIAHNDELGFEPPIIKVQIKSSEDTIGEPTVSALYGKVAANEFGLFITLGGYSSQAKSFARNKSNLRLIDGEELVSLILQHYEQFDSQYKGLLPLKKVYVPEAIEEEEE